MNEKSYRSLVMVERNNSKYGVRNMRWEGYKVPVRRPFTSLSPFGPQTEEDLIWERRFSDHRTHH